MMSISNLFCECFILWFIFNVVMLFQPVYIKYKSVIDQTYGNVKGIATNVFAIIDAKIPKFKDPSIKTQ